MSNSSLLNHKIHRQEILQMGYGQFLRNHTFVNHQKIHFKEKTHKCNECGIASRNNSVLLSHRRLHYISQKLYKYKDCGKAFAQNSGLACHVKIHSGEKP